MGCEGSTIDKTQSILNRKPIIWFIGGGPGSNKGKIIEYLIRDYKFKYLSSFDIIQFQKERNGADAQKIKQLMNNKQQFPSQLVIKLIKKVIASLGSRRFLIDGFPRNLQDIQQFNNSLTQKQIIFKKFIYIQVSEQKMKKSGLEAKKDSKKSQQQLTKQVQTIIDQYKKQIGQINDHFKQKGGLLKVDGNISQQQAYRDLRLSLNQLKVRSIEPGHVNVYFAHFDDGNHEFKYCDDLVRKYGLYFYNCKRLIQQAKSKNGKQAKFIVECQKNKKSVPTDFVLNLIRKKIQKKDYYGNFLISGFPRTISDSEDFDRTFGWQVSVQGYLSFQIADNKFKQIFQKNSKQINPSISKEDLQKNFQGYQKNQKVVCEYYEKQQKLLKIYTNDQKLMFNSINTFFETKGLRSRKNNSNTQLIFVSTINSDGQKINQALNDKLKTINMAYLYQNEINEKNLYSQLIASFVHTGKPVPGQIAVKILLKNLNFLKQSKVIVKGFPNSAQQLMTWEQQVGEEMLMPKVLYFNTNQQSIKTLLDSQKISRTEALIKAISSNAEQVQKSINAIDWKHWKIVESTTTSQIKNFVEKQG